MRRQQRVHKGGLLPYGSALGSIHMMSDLQADLLSSLMGKAQTAD